MEIAYTLYQFIVLGNEPGYFDLHNCYEEVGVHTHLAS